MLFKFEWSLIPYQIWNQGNLRQLAVRYITFNLCSMVYWYLQNFFRIYINIWWTGGVEDYSNRYFFCFSCCVIVFEHSCQSLSENSYPISRSRKILIHSEIGFMQLEILVRNKILHFSLKMMPVILDILYVAILNFSDPHALTYYSWYSILKSSIKIPK